MILLLLGLSTGYLSFDRDYTVFLRINELNDKTGLPIPFKEEKWGFGGSVFVLDNHLAMSGKLLRGNETMDLDSIFLNLSFNTKLVEIGYGGVFSPFIISINGGGGYSTLNLNSNKENLNINFSESLMNPMGGISYKSSSFVLSISGMGMLAISDYLGLGVSLGYIHSLRSPELTLEGEKELEVQEAPKFPLHKWYIKLSITTGDFTSLLEK
ncbi:MAG: hypothetical protein ABIN61_03280 [candidate division WOR-3 bacterium]